MSALMVSVSGIRGIIGDSFTPDVIIGYLQAYTNVVGKGTIYVGRDPRPHGEMVENIVCGTLLSLGCKVVKLGITPTPTVEIMVANRQAAGGIIITASHNPPQWNALKFINGKGMFLEKDVVNQVIKRFNEGWKEPLAPWDGVPMPETDSSSIALHLQKILAVPFIDKEAIRRRTFTVVVDCNHGVGGVMARQLLEELGCTVIALGETPDGKFEHPCEPVPAHLGMLCEAVKRENADVGFAIDPDGDRVAIVSEQGIAIGEEYTLAIGTSCILSRKKGPITVNLSTSRMSEDIAIANGCQCFRAPVGEINVASAMKQNGSVVGGEGNGGVMIPEVHTCRDAFGGMALCLQFLVDRNASISAAVTQLPSYCMKKETAQLGSIDADALLKEIERRYSEAKADWRDGLHLSWSDKWLHVRKSNTERILRIIAETKTAEETKRLIESVRGLIPGNNQ